MIGREKGLTRAHYRRLSLLWIRNAVLWLCLVVTGLFVEHAAAAHGRYVVAFLAALYAIVCCLPLAVSLNQAGWYYGMWKK